MQGHIAGELGGRHSRAGEPHEDGSTGSLHQAAGEAIGDGHIEVEHDRHTCGSFQTGELPCQEEGGDGVTVVKLKG